MVIDNFSFDGTYSKLKQFISGSSLSQKKVSYIKNKEKKTEIYNLIHAAYSFCRDGEVQLVMRGGESFIGDQALKFFNAVYQQDSGVWAAYSNHIFTNFAFGQAREFGEHISDQNREEKLSGIHMDSANSWYVDVIRSIPL